MRTLTARIAILFALLGTGGVRAEGELVIVDQFRLVPDMVEIGVGETLTFQVDEDETLVEPMRPFTLRSDDGVFHSPPLSPGDVWRFVPERTGVLHYHLEENDSVKGVIVVE